MFVYRDTGHYYYPLFEWTSSQWSHGNVPLWNPQENLGEPLAADATASLFYPGKLVFVLPLGFRDLFQAVCYRSLFVGCYLSLCTGATLADQFAGSCG